MAGQQQQQVYLFDVNFNLQSLCPQLARAIRGGHKEEKRIKFYNKYKYVLMEQS